MRRSFVMPKLGLTMTEGLLSQWTVEPGARFDRDQTVFVVETDKAANDVAAEAAGVLLEIVHGAGSTVPVGEVIAWWDDGVPAQEEPPSPPSPVRERTVATPLARREAARHGIELDRLQGSGPHGRITARDVLEATSTARTEAADQRGKRIEPPRIAAAAARRMVHSKQQVPHFYLAREADVGQLLAFRQELATHAGLKLTINHLIVAAVGRALRESPQATRIWDDGAWLELGGSDVGVAVNTGQGLLVPIVRNAGDRDLADIAAQSRELVRRARDGSLRAQDMEGACITVSNAGMFAVTHLTPIINPGQAMILGVGSVRELFRPGGNGQPELRREMGLVLACDHRVLDGVCGLDVLARIVKYLEHPSLLMLAADTASPQALSAAPR